MQEQNAIADAISIAVERARGLVDRFGLVGYGVAVLLDRDGNHKQIEPFANLITSAGDEYYARKAMAGVAPAAPAAPTAASGMKLGSGAVAVTKSGAEADLGAYIAGSNNPFDAGFPAAAAVAGDGGWNVNYKTSWLAGDVTNGAITEIAIVNDAGTDLTSTAVNTYARAVFAEINKTATDSLAVTWTHKFLGA